MARIGRHDPSDPWTNDPGLVRDFLNAQPSYEQLAAEVAFSLRRALQLAGIPFASISHRAKELGSYLEKVNRRKAKAPLSELTDLAGARVVCFYHDDLSRIASIIRSNFQVTEFDDKSENAGVDRFGYGGIHFLVHIGDESTGARYDDLRRKVCEVQVRTVMQDAWAVVSHHLLYKREEDTPKTLRRNINALAGALDSADIAFQAIRQERDTYLAEVSRLISANQREHLEINVDTLRSFLKEKYPDLPFQTNVDEEPEWTLLELEEAGLNSIEELNNLLDRASDALTYFAKHHPFGEDYRPTSFGLVGIALLIADAALRGTYTIAEPFAKLYSEAAKRLR